MNENVGFSDAMAGYQSCSTSGMAGEGEVGADRADVVECEYCGQLAKRTTLRCEGCGAPLLLDERVQ
jgi:DNA-directed RNA polymerase subunit RPC12/RpoP